MIFLHPTSGAIAVTTELRDQLSGAVAAVLCAGGGMSRFRTGPRARTGQVIPFPRAARRIRRTGGRNSAPRGKASRLDLIAATVLAALVAAPRIWISGAFEIGGLIAGVVATLVGGFVATVALDLLSPRWRLAAHAALLALTLGAWFVPDLRASALLLAVVAWLRWDLR